MERKKVYPEYLQKLPNYEDQEVERIQNACMLLHSAGVVDALDSLSLSLQYKGEIVTPHFVIPIMDPEMKNNPRIEAQYPAVAWIIAPDTTEPIRYTLMFNRNTIPHIQNGAVVNVTKFGDVITAAHNGNDKIIVSHRYMSRNEQDTLTFSQTNKALSLEESQNDPLLMADVVQDLFRTLPARQKIGQ